MNDTAPRQPAPSETTDSFFVLRDCREHFQRRLSAILNECGITAAATIEAVTQAFGDTHDELASQTRHGGFDETRGLTASRISLVGNDDLDIEIRIGDLTARLKGNKDIDYWRVQLRYMTLLNRPDMRPEQNPLGLEPVSQCLWALNRNHGGSLDDNLALLDRVEDVLQQRLPGVYDELNDLLERHHVIPAQAGIVQRTGSSPSRNGTNQASLTTATADALSALHQAIRVQTSGALHGEASIAGNTASGTFDVPAGNAALNATAVVMLNHLMERLNVLETRQLEAGIPAAGQGALQAIKSKDLDLPLGSSAGIALDTLSMIFEAIFATPDLPDSVKAAIGRLQIPLLRRAIVDPGFFGDTEHPARRALNRMARAAIGLPRDTHHNHPVCERLAGIAEAVKTGLETDDGDISGQIATIEKLIAERDQAVATAAQPFIQLVRDHESRSVALTQVQAWLDQALQTPLPIEISGFFERDWRRVMEIAHHQDGGAGESWKTHETTARELAWSVQPKQTAEDRKILLQTIPLLLRKLNAGLDLADMTPEQRKPFLDACFDLQTAALRNKSDTRLQPTAKPASGQNSASTTANPTPILLTHGDLRVHYLGPTTSSPWRSAGSPACKEGDWIAFELPQEGTQAAHLCGRLCWQGTPYATAVLYNPVWSQAVALPPAWLEQQFRSRQARVVSGIQLFDDAATRALGQVLPK